MLVYKNGDILSNIPVSADDNPVHTFIVHQVNCMGAMGAGLAKQISNLYPVVKLQYKQLCSLYPGKKSRNLLGTIQAVDVKSGITIINLFGQQHYRKASIFPDTRVYTKYLALRYGFEAIHEIALKQSKYSSVVVRIPAMIGCGLANGNPHLVNGIINTVFNNPEVNRIYTVELWQL